MLLILLAIGRIRHGTGQVGKQGDAGFVLVVFPPSLLKSYIPHFLVLFFLLGAKNHVSWTVYSINTQYLFSIIDNSQVTSKSMNARFHCLFSLLFWACTPSSEANLQCWQWPIKPLGIKKILIHHFWIVESYTTFY